jgi:murein DD-endopeptidase MepM/ murein hydrolase activator NlpD
LRIDHENQRLRAENDKQRQELQNLNNRVDAVEDKSRKLAEVSGVQEENKIVHGQGGPARPVDSAAALVALDLKTAKLERELRMYEGFLREHGMTPSIWPVIGKLESGVGGRRNPFGGRGYEYHEGQDIDAVFGTPVQAAASGRVIIAGRQRGYGNVVYVDHGGGLSTRYGHLSEIDVSVGQTVTRGQMIGLVGSTGRSTGPHLHYEVRINNQPVDPRQYLPGAEKQ